MPDPHRRAGGAGGCLNGEREPEERAGRDERHGIHRQAGQAQSRLHLGSLLSAM